MSDHVFICYAREDEAFVLQLGRNLKARGVPVWLDQLDISPGSDWDRSIDEAIYDCAKFIIVLSSQSVESTEVRGELRTALDEKKPIIPVIRSTCRVPRQLRTIQHVDFTSRGPDDEAALRQLLRTLVASTVIEVAQQVGAPDKPAREAERSRAEAETKLKADDENQRRIDEERNRAQQEAERRRLEAETQRKVEEERHREEERKRSEEEAKRKAQVEEQKRIEEERSRAQQEAERRRLEAEAQRKADEERLRAEERKRPGAVFRDKLKDGSEGPEMVVVPAGTFKMGDIQGKGVDSEKPVHTVSIPKAFAIGRYQITFEDYDRFASATSRSLPNDEGWGRGRQPAINVSWEDAVEYAKWLSEQTGKRYRLPTEAEWEYAARAGTETEYWWGNEMKPGMANCDGGDTRWGGKQTSPVGSFPPNPFGLYDTAGNVWEWVQDNWHENYQGAPADGTAWEAKIFLAVTYCRRSAGDPRRFLELRPGGLAFVGPLRGRPCLPLQLHRLSSCPGHQLTLFALCFYPFRGGGGLRILIVIHR